MEQPTTRHGNEMRIRQAVLLFVLFFLLGLFLAQRLPAALAQLTGRSDYGFFDPIIEIYSTVSEHYVDGPDEEMRENMQNEAIAGMLEALDDPYTQYIPAADSAAFNKDLTGQFVGIGAEVISEDGWLTIVSPLEDSPAAAAGIRPEDRIIEIEGKTTFNEPIDDSIARLTGIPGTPVKIVVERGPVGAGERLPMTIVRAQITMKSVKGLYREPGAASTSEGGRAAEDPRGGHWNYIIRPATEGADGTKRGPIAYVRLSQFTPTAADELRAVLTSLRADKPENEGGLGGLILDLRGDPGGVLESAVEIADMFLEKGTIVSVRGRGEQQDVHVARAAGTFEDFPLAVLINGASASASEIVAGSLSDNGRATIIGTRSFGKGLVQSVHTLRHGNGAQLKFTSARYYLPSGRLIHRTDESTEWGVDPTPGFFIPLTEDEQIDRLMRRREWDVFQNGSPAADNGGSDPRWTDPDWIENELKDKQLAGAVRAITAKLDTGEWTPISSEQITVPGQAVSMAELRQLELGRERLLRELERVERRLDTLDATLAGDAALPPEHDLWPDEVELTDGSLKVYDKDGKLVRTLRITGPNLERWLMDAAVEPLNESTEDADAENAAPAGTE